MDAKWWNAIRLCDTLRQIKYPEWSRNAGVFIDRFSRRPPGKESRCWMMDFPSGMAKSHGTDLQERVSFQSRQPGNSSFTKRHWVGISASGFSSVRLCLTEVTNGTKKISDKLNLPKILWFGSCFAFPFPAACHNFSQLLPISTLSPFVQTRH